MNELLSKLKMAGKLHYWRGTIEIDEYELHAICDEIQAEYDNAIHALNKAAGNWAKADDELRELLEVVRCRDCKHFPGNCDWCYGDDPDGYCKWGERR